MSTIVPTISYITKVDVTAASSGDATTIAAMFNGIKFPAISSTVAAVATAASTVATISWVSTKVREGDDIVQNMVTNLIATNLALTSPIGISLVRTESLIV